MTDQAKREAQARADGPGDAAAVIVAVLTLPVVIYLAIWQIDWAGISFIAPLGFCVIVPSVVGSTTGVVIRALSRHRDSGVE